jgi:hypothetical protein
MLATSMRALGDDEGERLPRDLPPVIDAHVHVFPDRMFAAIWRWFEAHGWPIRYPLETPALIHFLLSRGVERIVALHYAHKPGIARMLNRYVAEVCRDEPRVLGAATVFPGEPGARGILDEAFAAGLRAVKIHCHVQAIAADDAAMHDVYEACVEHDAPLVMHAGREPRSAAYARDPHQICGAERIDRVLRAYPKLRLCVPHLGADEFDAYAVLLERHDHLWLDTTMMLADYFPLDVPPRLWTQRPERVMYGTDFPSLPYAWDREVKRIARSRIAEPALAKILGETARDFFGIASR